MVRFAEGELALPIRSILWAPSNSAHFNHLHVEGPHVSGTLANCTSKWTEAITEIRGALDGHFGEGDHYQVWDDTLAWTHMGVYSCRNIANTNTPSQHAFSNAIDIGPYYGVAEQQKFYDFLTRKKGEDEDMPMTQADADLFVNSLMRYLMEVDSPANQKRKFETVIRSIRYDSQRARQYALLGANRAVNVLNAIDDIDVDLDAAEIQAIVDAIEAEGIADAVADEIDARARARLAE